MSRPGRPAAEYGSKEHRQRVSRGVLRHAEVQKELQSVSPSDLQSLRRGQALPEKLRPLWDAAADTVLRLRGDRELSPQRVALLEAAQRLLLLGMAETSRALQQGDGEAASRAGTLLSKFAVLVKDAIGLDVEHEVPSLAQYLEQRKANGNGSDPEPDPGEDVAAERNVERDAPASAQDGEEPA